MIGPFALGRSHAREMLQSMADVGAVPKYPLYLSKEEIAPDWGYWSFDQYLKGARSVLGQYNVRQRTEATPAAMA